ncbi:MAG: FAD binding domain-containing protein [Geodermatophilaceae bacterium]
MKPFALDLPADPAHAVAALAADPGARFLAGGTNLLDLMKLGVERPRRLFDVSRLPLDGIDLAADGTISIGATVRNSDLGVHPEIRRRLPMLSQALLAGASGQLRNMATTGGNLLQRTRCVYFQDVGKPCNKRVPGSGCPARDGDHRNLAVLGASQSCIATHPSDLAVALAAADAVVHLVGPDGERSLPVTALYRLPADDPQRDTTLAHGELIVSVRIPPLAYGGRSAYRKVRDRASYAFAVASVAAAVDVADGTVRDVRLALGAVAPLPWRARVAEDALRGGPATEAAYRAAIEAELGAAQPLPDNAFKLPLVANIVTRTLLDLTGAPA